MRKTILMAMVAALLAALTMGTALADSRPAWKMGTSGDDRIVGNKYPDHIKALGGRDYVNGRGGPDVILGGAGNDGAMFSPFGALHGDSPSAKANSARDGNDVVKGQKGDDSLFGWGGSDRLIGGPGDDQIVAVEDRRANNGTKVPSKKPGKDVIRGGSGNDFIDAKDGYKDRIHCGDGRDTVYFDKNLDRVAPDCERKNPRGGI